MTELWKPTAPKRTKHIEHDMRRQARPNPYTLTAEDIGCRVFGSRITHADVGIRCQLVWNDERTTPILQMESRAQRDRRLDRGYRERMYLCKLCGTEQPIKTNHFGKVGGTCTHWKCVSRLPMVNAMWQPAVFVCLEQPLEIS